VRTIALPILAVLCGCTAPVGVRPVSNFDVQRYMGVWYEVARLDHWFERGLVNVTATYTAMPDGSIHVVNRGFDSRSSLWVQAEGRAVLAGKPGEGRLTVSFFRPFYAPYNVIALDRENYSYALVCGRTRSYLWILARAPRLPDDVLVELIGQANAMGFDTRLLIHGQNQETILQAK
jgi:apolipoprotein D and lipocalin family protein